MRLSIEGFRRLAPWLAVGAIFPVSAATPPSDGQPVDPRPVVILMIGDGMGPGILDAASRYLTGNDDGLALERLPVHAKLNTESVSGITDSAAAATAMACGVLTRNKRVGYDAQDEPCRNLAQTAHALGIAVGIVTTDDLFDATAASFTAHARTRANVEAIVREQLLVTRPEVMLGGGAAHYLSVAGIQRFARDSVATEGRAVARSRDDLLREVAAGRQKLWGFFAEGPLPWEADRRSDTPDPVPTLAELAQAALETLDRDPDGFLLLVEGGLIDMAAHKHDARRTIHEVVAFDRAVERVERWTRERPAALLLVTADHDTGAPRPVGPFTAGELPEVEWGAVGHSRIEVDLFAKGPGTELVDGRRGDLRWVHALINARLRDIKPRLPSLDTGDEASLRPGVPTD
jgi:alkaline phosphatase